MGSIISAVIVAALVDYGANFLRKQTHFPTTAVISALIIGIVLTANVWITALAAIVAILSKHIIRFKGRHIFNPANFGVLITLLIFNSYQTWWGATNYVAVIVLGLVIAYKMRRFHLVISFLAVNFILTLLETFILNSDLSAFLSGYLMNGTMLFFVFVMVMEPKTSPIRRQGRIIFAAMAAIFSFFIKIFYPELVFVGALAAANLFVPLLNARLRPRTQLLKPQEQTTDVNQAR
mgnify:FL=1